MCKFGFWSKVEKCGPNLQTANNTRIETNGLTINGTFLLVLPFNLTIPQYPRIEFGLDASDIWQHHDATDETSDICTSDVHCASPSAASGGHSFYCCGSSFEGDWRWLE